MKFQQSKSCSDGIWISDLNQHRFFPILLLRLLPGFRYTKHSRQCFTTFPNTSKFVQNTPLRVVFSTLHVVWIFPMKHCLLCSIYYMKSANLDFQTWQKYREFKFSQERVKKKCECFPVSNRPFATHGHMGQNPPCWRASLLLFPHWDIQNKENSNMT